MTSPSFFFLITNFNFQPSAHFEASAARAPITEVCRPPHYGGMPILSLSTVWSKGQPVQVVGTALGRWWARCAQYLAPPLKLPGTLLAPCSRPSDPAATADESGPRSAPNPSQPVENFHLHPDRQLEPIVVTGGLLSHKNQLAGLFSASQLLSCLREKGWRRWMGSDQAAPCLLSIPQTVSGRLPQKRNHLQTFRILFSQSMRIS